MADQNLSQQVRHLLIVSRCAQPPTTARVPARVPGGLVVEWLTWLLLLSRPLDHQLVPDHRRATLQERRLLRPLSSLPVLFTSDPVVRYLGLTGGDVVRIARQDGTVYWRLLVVSGN